MLKGKVTHAELRDAFIIVAERKGMLPFPKMSRELDAPESNCLMAYANASESQLFLDVPITVIETVVYPYSLANDRYRKTVAMGSC